MKLWFNPKAIDNDLGRCVQTPPHHRILKLPELSNSLASHLIGDHLPLGLCPWAVSPFSFLFNSWVSVLTLSPSSAVPVAW